jgi:hypothetical protein
MTGLSVIYLIIINVTQKKPCVNLADFLKSSRSKLNDKRGISSEVLL